jgi:hypothetical protein
MKKPGQKRKGNAGQVAPSVMWGAIAISIVRAHE